MILSKYLSSSLSSQYSPDTYLPINQYVLIRMVDTNGVSDIWQMPDTLNVR